MEITPELLQQIRENKRVRQRLAFESPLWFSLLYLQHYFECSFAPFHLEMFNIVAEEKYQLVVVMAFRGSGKSTVMNMATVLWSILGKPGKKFVIIASKTQDQAKNHFANIKTELETNELLREDFGPFTEKPEEWRKLSLDLIYHDAKILSVAREQSIRGLRHEQHRPDLIICDDLEDSGDTGNGEKIYDQFAREIGPSGEPGTRVIVLGNLIDKDSFMMRLRRDALNRPDGVFRAYPIADSRGKILWPGKYPDWKSIEQFEKSIPKPAWVREYELDALTEVSYYEPPGESKEKPEWFKSRTRELSRQTRKAARAYRLAIEQTGEATYQTALIPPMKKFSIESPFPKNLLKIGFSLVEPEIPVSPHLRKFRDEMKQLSYEYSKILKKYYWGD